MPECASVEEYLDFASWVPDCCVSLLVVLEVCDVFGATLEQPTI